MFVYSKGAQMAKFTSPPDREYFNHLVWGIVNQVPEGKVTTYGFVAGLIPPPPGMEPSDYRAWGARWVGGAMAACPAGVPWQRVISAQGKISLRPGSGGTRQREMLEAEGILFDERGKINLATYGWNGPGEEWLRAHGLIAQDDMTGVS